MENCLGVGTAVREMLVAQKADLHRQSSGPRFGPELCVKFFLMSTTNAVAVFSTNFLAYSQTFIQQGLLHHRRYRAEVFCHRRLNRALFPYGKVHALSDGRGLLGRAEAILYKLTTLSPTFRRRLKTGGFSLLHAHFGPGAVYALPYHLGLKIPLVVTFHGYDVPILTRATRFLPLYWRYWAASKCLLRRADRFFAASEDLAKILIEAGAPRDRVRVTRLGVEIPPPRSPGRASGTVLMVGRFVEKKGFEYGIRAFSRVAQNHPGSRLCIVGGGTRRRRYEKLIQRLDLRDRVELTGVLSYRQTLNAMEDADVVVAPSVVARNGNRDSGLMVIKEAAARSVPSIGTLHGGIPEIIDEGVTGFLVPERDVEALADRLARLLDDSKLRARMGRAARLKMEAEYDIRLAVEQLERHYDEVCLIRP